MKPEKVEELIQNHLDMSLSSEQKSLLEEYLETHAEARRIWALQKNSWFVGHRGRIRTSRRFYSASNV